MSRGNALLDRLAGLHPEIADELRLEHFHRSQTIEAGNDLVFPAGGAIALYTSAANGLSAELGLIGREGFFGGRADRPDVPVSGVGAHVAIAGAMWCLPSSVASEAIAVDARVGSTLERFIIALEVAVGRQALCNLHHSLDQRVCRWLLTAGDRLASDSFDVTQEDLAQRLGVRRASVNVVARGLQAAAAIRYSSGHVRLMDRSALAGRACDCYAELADRYRALDT